MKVAFVSTFPPAHCGIGEYTHFLTEQLALYENPVYVFSAFGARKKKGRVWSVPCFEQRTEDLSRPLEEIAAHGPFDVVHIQHEYGIFGEGKSFLNFLKELRKYTKVICITLHTVIHSLNRRLSTYQQEMIDLVDGVFVHSALGEYELWSQNVDLKKVFMVPHGTYINRMPSTREGLSKIIGVDLKPDSSFIITIPGFLRWDKGITILEEICSKVINEFPDTVIVVAGSYQATGKELSELKAAVNSLDRNFGQVCFAKGFLHRRDLFKILASSDAILFPYLEWPGHMGVSGALHLAMGTRKPILAARVPRLVEYTEMFPELSFAKGDVDGLMEAMRYLRRNYERVLKEVKKRLIPFLLRTNWKATAKRHLEIYGKLLRGYSDRLARLS